MKVTVEDIKREFIDRQGNFCDVAAKFDEDVAVLEKYCLDLCVFMPDEFHYKYFLTKEWFEEKLEKFGSLRAISDEYGIHYRTLCYFKSRVIPQKQRRIAKELDYETIYDLYIEKRMTDREIADLYGTATINIKRLRKNYEIGYKDRESLEEKLPIEVFHRFYVFHALGLGQIAELFQTSRVSVTKLRDAYISMNLPLSAEIESTNNVGRTSKLYKQLCLVMSKEDLIQALKKKTIVEIAGLQGITQPTANSLAPLSKEWLKAELLTKTTSQIAEECVTTPSRISALISKYGLEKYAKVAGLSELALRELYIERGWSDTLIAEHLGVSSYYIKSCRLNYGIHKDQRPSAAEKISPVLFDYLYVKEKMPLREIATAYSYPIQEIRELRQKYIAEGYERLKHRPAKAIIPERLMYLKKQIKLGILSVEA